MASTTTDTMDKNSGVLLLGASGQLGRMLRHFWRAPPDLVGQSRRPAPDFIPFDLILEPEKAIAAMARKCAVICLSGVTPARANATKDGYSRNTDLALAAVKCAAQAKVPQVFLTSSAAVYGANPGVQDETSVPHPISEYGTAKLDMERAAIACANTLDQKATVLRIGNVAGADAILGGWQDGKQLDQLPDGTTPRRSYIGPQTLTRVMAQLCQRTDLPDVLNLTSPGVIEMGALLDAASLPWTPRPAPASVIPEVALCTKRLERHVSFTPQDCTAAGMVAQWRQHTGAEGTA